MADTNELTAKLKAAAPYEMKFSRLWERYDEACHGNSEHMRDILELTLDALETAERRIANSDRDVRALTEALEQARAQSSKWLEAYHKAVSIGARYEERIAELERDCWTYEGTVKKLLERAEAAEAACEEAARMLESGERLALSRATALLAGIKLQIEGE